MRKLGSDGYNGDDKQECELIVEEHRGCSISIQCIEATDLLYLDFVIQSTERWAADECADASKPSWVNVARLAAWLVASITAKADTTCTEDRGKTNQSSRSGELSSQL